MKTNVGRRFMHGAGGVGLGLIFAGALTFQSYPDPIPAFADPPQAGETPGLVHGTASPQEVNVQSLEPAPPVDETTPLQKVRPHVRSPEALQLRKELLEEGLLKPRTDVIEDTGDHPSSGTRKEGNP
jgi:hypothetical protein